MIIVDTSVWMLHFREGVHDLKQLLYDEQVMCHPFIIGELACGNLKNRSEILSLMQVLPKATLAQDVEVLRFIEMKQLMGKGLGYIDVHLSASALLAGVRLWSLDKRLNEATEMLGIRYNPAAVR